MKPQFLMTSPKFIWMTLILSTLMLILIAPVSRESVAQPPIATPTAIPTLNNGQPIVLTIYFENRSRLAYLTSKLDVWQVDHQAQTATTLITDVEVEMLHQAGYAFEIDLPETTRLTRISQLRPTQDTGIPGFSCYRTVEETFATLTQLEADFPQLVQVIDIGDSWQKTKALGGYDIQAVRITNNAKLGPKAKLVLLSTVHARELATAEMATRFAERLVTGYGTDPDITWLLDYNEVHIIPQANPDGRKQAEIGLSWRKNVDNEHGCSVSSRWGVDLNRNSSFQWNTCAGCSSSDACATTYRGPNPASEPETQAFESYVTALFPNQQGPTDTEAVPLETSGLFISLHSYGEWILFPWGAQTGPSPNNTQLETLGRKFGYYTGYETCQSGEPGCIYPTDGTHDDWAYGTLGMAAYTFELGTTFFQTCSYFEETIVPENMSALLYAVKAARRPYQTPAGPETLQITVTPPTVMSGTQVVLSAIASDSRYASNGWGAEPVQNIQAARYSINHPSWLTSTTTYALTAADGLFDSPLEAVNATIDTTGWPAGQYHLLLESQDIAGNWGVPSAVVLSIESPVPSLTISPTLSTQWTLPGQTVTHTLYLSSNRLYTDTLNVSLSTHQWPTSAPVTISSGLMGTTQLPLQVGVQPPLTTPLGEFETITLTVTPNSQVLATSQVVMTTTVIGQLFWPNIRWGPFAR